MTRINREQFKKEFQDGINIDNLSKETRTALKEAGISKATLKEIANGDRKIEGAELDKLFNAMDGYDMRPSDGYLNTSLNPGIPTPTGKAFDRLKSEYDRNLAINILRGPQIQKSKVDSTSPKVSLFDGHTDDKTNSKSHHHPHSHKQIDWDPLSPFPSIRRLFNHLPHNQQMKIIKTKLHNLGYDFNNNDFQKAVEKKDISALSLFIKGHISDANRTFLSLAENGDTTAVQAMLDAGMDPNIHDKYGRTPLMLTGNNEIVEALVDARADTTARDKNGKTVLMYQAENSAGISMKLQKSILEKSSVDATDNSGKTALMYAAGASNTTTMDQLLSEGAYINAKDNGNSTALTYAVANGWTNTAEYLLQKGVSPQSGWSEEGSEAPLIIAIRNQDKKMVELLLNNPDIDVDVFDASSKYSETALDIAIAEGADDIVQLLKSKGAHRLEDY